MIPIRDTIPSRRVAILTRLLLTINVAVFAIELLQGDRLEVFVYRFGVVPAHWVLRDAQDLVEWPRLLGTLVSSQFLHGGLFHLASNMLYLWIFADNVEDALGHVRFLALYLTSGIVAAMTQMLVSPASSVPMVGASGAIAGVLGAYVLLFPFARIVALIPWGFVWESTEIPAWVFLGFWFLLQWLQGLTTIGDVASVGGIAWWAHIGGFVCGMVLVLWFRPRRRW